MLTGNKTILREPQEKDYPFFLDIRNNLEVQSMLLSLPRANSITKVKDWLENSLKEPSTIFFVIAEKETNNAIGYIQLKNMNFINGTAELGICLSEKFHGNGFSSEALSLLENYASNIFNIRKVTLLVINSNSRAINFYKKLNYSEVGIFKNHFYHNQKFHDILIMEKFIIV